MWTRKHLLLWVIGISMTVLTAATFFYPGGSQQDAKAVGYSWQHNYLCNLFNEKAINGVENGAKYIAIVGLLFLCVSFALFFYRFSLKIQDKKAANVIKYAGIGTMFFSAFAPTSYHDSVTTVSSTLGLLALFYILVFVFRSKLTLFKLLTLVTMILLYVNNYVYYSQQGLYFLPILQKITIFIILVLMLSLDYFTTKEDFAPSVKHKD